MYIEFELIIGLRVKSVRSIINVIDQWAADHNISQYKTKIHKGCLRLTFDDECNYSLFALSWNPQQHDMLDYSMIEPMKTRH